MQVCVRFAGDTAGLREWAVQTGLKTLPPGGQAAFLHDQPGIAFDASNTLGKLVLVSGDVGTCSVIAEHGQAARLASVLERSLAEAAIGVSAPTERSDTQEPALHYREYQARKGPRAWRLILGTGSPDSGVPPMLTAIPE